MQMKILSVSFMLISKLKTNHTITSCAKFSFFRHRYNLLRKIYLPSSLPAHRSFSAGNTTFKVESLSRHALFNHGKLFKEKENEYAHKIMENLSQYSNSLLKHPLSLGLSTLQSEELGDSSNSIVDEFAKVTLQNLSDGLSLENSKFTNLVRKLCSSLSEVSDEDIKKILHYLCMWPPTANTTTTNFKSLWNMLDRECVKRMSRWDVSQKLLFADYWFHLRLGRISQYNSALIYNLIQNINSLSNHQLIQLMFYINVQRKIPEALVPKLEKKLESIIKFLTPEELGIVCLGFFKTQNKISDVNLIKCIIKHFMLQVENLNTLTVVAVLKFLRISMNPSLGDLYILTLHKCIPHIDNFDIPTRVHLVLLSSECNVYHPLLLSCVSEKLAKDMANVRLKDCGKLIMSSSLFNHFEKHFYHLYFAELKKEERQNEINSHPLYILHSVLSYAYMGHYNYDFIAKIFKKEYMRRSILLSPEMSHSYAELDYCIEIECPDYTGPRLDVSERKVLQNRRGNLPGNSHSQNMQTRLLGDVYESLVEILGSDKNVLIRHILPHVYSPDIIVRLSGNMDKSLSDLCQEFSTDFVLKPPVDEIWAAFVVGGIYSFARKSTQMTGITAMKLRQLKKIGYCVTFIPYFNVYRKVSQRNAFLKEQLNMLEEKCQTIAI